MGKFKANLRMYGDFFAGWWKYRDRIKRNRNWVEKYAEAKGLRVNPHKMFYTNLMIWIEENRDMYGRQHCPCFEPSGDPALDKKLHCPCAFVMDDIATKGTCHCTLFGRGDMTDEEFEQAEARLTREYRPKLNLTGNLLDTRGQPKDEHRGLDVPDAVHQVKQGLNAVSGDLEVLVDRQASVQNLKLLADYKGLGFQSTEVESGLYRAKLVRR